MFDSGAGGGNLNFFLGWLLCSYLGWCFPLLKFVLDGIVFGFTSVSIGHRVKLIYLGLNDFVSTFLSSPLVTIGLLFGLPLHTDPLPLWAASPYAFFFSPAAI